MHGSRPDWTALPLLSLSFIARCAIVGARKAGPPLDMYLAETFCVGAAFSRSALQMTIGCDEFNSHAFGESASPYLVHKNNVMTGLI
jgi:hypothetical protein